MPVNSFKRKQFVGEIIFQTVRWYLKYALSGPVAKNLALLQNQCKPSQLGKLINLIAGKMAHKGNNYSVKVRKYYFCTTI